MRACRVRRLGADLAGPWPPRGSGRRTLAGAAVAALAALAAVWSPPVLAQQTGTGDPAAGRRVAETWCSNCHVIGPGASGPASDAVPTFPAVAGRTATTDLSLRVFLQTPHANMPNFQLSRAELDDVVAYILSLKRG